MTRPFLTVLTTPVLDTPARLYRGLRRTLRQTLKPRHPVPVPARHPGHPGVVRSVVAGLGAIEANFNVNPERIDAVGDAVYAPANEALRQAIEWKRNGRIRLLVAGPVNAFIPTECDGILLSPEIDIVIVASEWVRAFYQQQAPALSSKIRVCPAGVDVEYWTPPPARADRLAGNGDGTAVIYEKSVSGTLRDEAARLVQSHGFTPVHVRYGAYDRDGYKQALTGAAIGVFLSPFETQGLALAEAWAMDVPTFVWDPRQVAEWKGHEFTAGSSCPYLTAATGVAWQTLPQLDAALRQARRGAAFTPRAWVLAHMTDAICAGTLYRIIQDAALVADP